MVKSNVCLESAPIGWPIETHKETKTFSLFNENILPKEKILLLKALEYLANISDDWNGYKAKAPNEGALKLTGHFITLLPFNKKHANKIEPDGDGGVNLIWITKESRTILTFDGQFIHGSIKQEDSSSFIDEVPFFDSNDEILSSEILDLVPAKGQQ